MRSQAVFGLFLSGVSISDCLCRYPRSLFADIPFLPPAALGVWWWSRFEYGFHVHDPSRFHSSLFWFLVGHAPLSLFLAQIASSLSESRLGVLLGRIYSSSVCSLELSSAINPTSEGMTNRHRCRRRPILNQDAGRCWPGCRPEFRA